MEPGAQRIDLFIFYKYFSFLRPVLALGRVCSGGSAINNPSQPILL